MSWDPSDEHEPEVGDDGLTDAQREEVADEINYINCRHLIDVDYWRGSRGAVLSAFCELHGGCLGIGTDCGRGCCPDWEAEHPAA